MGRCPCWTCCQGALPASTAKWATTCRGQWHSPVSTHLCLSGAARSQAVEVGRRGRHTHAQEHTHPHLNALLQPGATTCPAAELGRHINPNHHHHTCSSIALCGGSVKNATVGRILSPSPRLGPTATHDRSCSWSLEAPTAQRLHLHLERLALEPTDR